jgi:hypothetical protein
MNSEAIKVFVGCAPNGEDAESMMVLEYSAKKYCTRPLEFVWMMISPDPNSYWYGWNTTEWATPFSAFRCGIPEYCEFQGQAIYMDSDVMVLADLAELCDAPWESDTAVIQAKGRWRMCVCKLHNERCRDNPVWPRVSQLRHHANLYKQLFGLIGKKASLVQEFDKNWNNFDGEDNQPLDQIKILHYTDMSSQPHLKYAIPRLAAQGRKHWYDGKIKPHARPDVEALFDQLYQEALDAGYCVSDYVPDRDVIDYQKASLVDWRFEDVPK